LESRDGGGVADHPRRANRTSLLFSKKPEKIGAIKILVVYGNGSNQLPQYLSFIRFKFVSTLLLVSQPNLLIILHIATIP